MGLQAWIRGWKSRKNYEVMKTRRMNLIVVQRNLKKYMKMRNWLWYGFWQQLRPTLNTGRVGEMMEKMEATAEKCEKNAKIAHEKNIKLQAENEILMTERDQLQSTLDDCKGGLGNFLKKENKLNAHKQELENQMKELNKRLEDEQTAKQMLGQSTKKVEQEMGSLRRDIEDIDSVLEKANQDKEKKMIQEANQKTGEDLQSIEDRCNHLNRVKAKLEQNLDELEDNLEREKKLRGDVDKMKRKTEGDLKLTQEAVADLERNQKELENTLIRKENETAALSSKLEDEQMSTHRTS